MRWLPTLSFSPSHSSSSTVKSTASSSSSPHAAVDRKKPSDAAARGAGAGAWLLKNSKKSTRPKKLRHVSDHDGKSPPCGWQDPDDDTLMPSSHSPSSFDRTCIRSNTSSVAPQPLPLPELSSSAALLRQRDGDRPLPSPKDATGPTGGSRGLEDRDRADGAALEGASTGFRIRSVFASQETRRNVEHLETRSSKMVLQDLSSSENTRDNFCVSVPARSAPNSPFASPTISPQKTRNSDFVPYYYVTPKGNQFWSAPEMPTSEALSGLPPPAFFDLSALGTDTSPHQSPQGRSPPRHPRSPTGPSSPLHPMLSLETSTGRRESNAPVSVHPLPLPPGAALLSPSATATFSQAVTKLESLSMKSQWQKGKLIGRGTFGSVYVATNRETGALCAMKEVEIFPDDPKSAECMKQLEQEIKFLSHLKHSNIVQYYGSEIVEDRFFIYLEYVHPGSINKYVREHCGAITESVVRNFTRHILSGLSYLHSKKTIHRDIKGANLLVDSAGVVKLADFGMAKHLTGQVAYLSLKGSPYWMAPELMQAVMQKDNSSDLAFAVDIWSLGCTIIEMFTGKPPWSEYEGAAAMFKVMRDTPPIPETLSSEGKDFLRHCFKRNPAERPTAARLLEHRFLKYSQQSDVSASSHLYSGTTLTDKSHSPRGQSENKPDQMPVPRAKIAKGKAAESIVRYTVWSAMANDTRIAASLLRLHFHDCFANGCDGSVLLDDTSTFKGEKNALPNQNSIRGFEVIDTIKSALEKACPSTVSCADLLALAAREAVYLSKGPFWSVPLGRRDGTTASESEANELPSPFEPLENITAKFVSKGLEIKDVAVLSGAHTFGFAHCFTFKPRLFNFGGSGKPDPTLDSSLLENLQKLCPNQDDSDTNLAPLDPVTTNRFDNMYYVNLVNNSVLLQSDQALLGDNRTASLVMNYSKWPFLFYKDFAASMEKMGRISVLTGQQGEIRKNCRVVN